MGIWSRLFGGGKSKDRGFDGSEAVIVSIPPSGDNRALEELEDPLIAVIDETGIGEYDGHGQNLETGVLDLFMYAADGEQLFTTVEPTLRRLKLPPGTAVLVRSNGTERTVTL